MAATRATQYVGWLLRVNRRLGGNEALRSGRTFAAAFRCDGMASLAPSHITRWENGTLAASRATIRRYEHLLGLPADSLVTVHDAVRRSELLDVATPDTGRGDPDVDRNQLYELLDRATGDGVLSGGDWGRLTELVAARPQLELYPPRLWRELADRLLAELVIAVNTAWLQRQEAMSRLLEHPAAQRHAVAACVALADDQTAPAVIEPLSLLDVTAHPDANRYVLDQLTRPHNERAMYGALLAAVRKVGQAHFRDEEWGELVRCVGAAMTDFEFSHTLLPLVVDLAHRLTGVPSHADKLRRALPASSVARLIWTVRRTSEPTAARSVSRRIANRAQSQLTCEEPGTDEILATLVEESLFLANPDQRMVASMLIAASPYQLPVARVLLDETKADLTRRGRNYPTTAALRNLTQLNVDIHRPLIHHILAEPGFNANIRHDAAWATPHMPGRYPAKDWLEIVNTQLATWRQTRTDLGEGIIQGLTYGIGTDGHRQILTQIRDSLEMPVSARRTAAWLLQRDMIHS
ncbi:hypothetical protein [Virgisporangium aurantiacum]|nr:hypothetical protein [Virgisporangium aurantiacum]